MGKDIDLNKINKNGFSIFVGEDGIWRINIGKKWTEKDLDLLANFFTKTVNDLPVAPNILVKIVSLPIISSHLFRNKAASFAKEMGSGKLFRKVAIWGGGVVQKIEISFIINASGFKNIKYFKTEEEALRWLNE